MTRWVLIGITALGLSGLLATVTLDPSEMGAAAATDSIERGRYLAKIGGCNDCHTPNYLEKAGNVPEDRWLIGDSLGFNGPWGTTYPTNLRQLLRTMSEDEWVKSARTIETRPPMPWFNLRAMTEADLRAIHRYVLSLPADDTPVPDYVPPGRPPKTPHIVFVPQAPKP
ncbi:cytochrome c [Mesorhizobium muleiense]|uniref:Cytochrome c, mono-and diheme variants n=1 Tax=Mesorhizobium muleiense TaxID=1004279 RepID=A0A1G8TVB1_9HYPH|nr:cytochrome c [Mesorhizobium muleiense]MCF6101423.1 cytochrome c [Mesorhizobium muleiense]SDJ45441.1 Cytochrome c, mono-and diheme variants [Mesorhizobium muleiense]